MEDVPPDFEKEVNVDFDEFMRSVGEQTVTCGTSLQDPVRRWDSEFPAGAPVSTGRCVKIGQRIKQASGDAYSRSSQESGPPREVDDLAPVDHPPA